MSTGRPILACDWKESGTKLDCYVKEGFRFNYIVTDRLTLEILNPTEEVAGQHACAFVSSGHRTVKECTITVKGKIFFSPPCTNNSETIYSLSQSKPDFFPPPPHPSHFPEREREEEEEEKQQKEKRQGDLVWGDSINLLTLSIKFCLYFAVPENEKREKDLHGQERKSNRAGK